MIVLTPDSSITQEASLIREPLQEKQPLNVQLFRRGDAEILDAFGQRVHVLLPGAATNGEVAFFEIEVPAGDGPPYHVHHREDETFFIRQGRFEFLVNGERHEVEAGDVVYGPRDVPHTFRNISASTSILQVLSVTAGFDSFFRACAEVFARPEGVAMDAIFEIAANHGLEFLSPEATPVSTEGIPAPRIIRSGQAETLLYPGADFNILVTSESTGGLFSVMDAAAAPGDGPPPHVHSREDEMLVLYNGEVTFGIGRDSFTAQAGDIVWLPRGTRHIFRCVSSTPAKGLVAIIPGTFENFFRDTGNLFAKGQFSPENMQRVFENYGIEALPPEI